MKPATVGEAFGASLAIFGAIEARAKGYQQAMTAEQCLHHQYLMDSSLRDKWQASWRAVDRARGELVEALADAIDTLRR